VPESALVSPQLTTIAQPIQEMGRHAVRMLLELLAGRELDMTHVTLPTELIVRQSTGPAPTSIVAALG
jgi:LacI family transcriptional regulator